MDDVNHELSKERLLSAILADSDDAILSYTVEDTILTWNESAELLYGYSSAEAIGQKMSLIIPPDRQDEEEAYVRRVIDGERIAHRPTTHVSRSSERLDVSVTMSPIEGDEDDRPIGVSVIVRDMTLAKRADKDRTRTEQRFRAIFERSGHGIAISTIDGQLIEVNEAMAQILGYETQEDVYKANIHMQSLYKNDEVRKDLLASMHESVLLEGIETQLRKRDGTFAWVWLNMVPILDSAGETSGLQAMVTDITLRRTLEEQLFHAQKMEAVGRLTGGIAHDFNNLLSVIMNYVDFAISEVDGHVQEDLQEVHQAATRAAALVRQLLTFSRRDVVVPEVLDLNEKIAATQPILARLLSDDVVLETSFEQDLWRVELDPTHAEQILLNLAVNANDAMPTGGKLTLRTENILIDEVFTEQHPDLAPGNYVCMTISDTGTGMSAETISHLFEPFYTTKSRESGTGLGLATVHGIVTSARGAVYVYSERGIGSTFRIYLPVTDSRLTDPAIAKGDEVSGGNERILIVDDEDALARIGSRVLERAGYDVQMASSAHHALEIAEAQEIDLLVTDIVMPGLSGADLALRVRGAHPGARVLLMSGYSEDLLAHRGFFSAEHRLLTKPFSASQLLRAVRATLDEKDDPAAARWLMHTPTVVLIVDNSPVRALIRTLLEESGYAVLGKHSDSGEGIEAARRVRPQFVVLDVLIPGPSSDLVAATLRSEHPDIKIIAVSAATTHKPDWADAFVPESRLNEFKETMSSLDNPARP